MCQTTSDFAHLALLIARLQDAEFLLDAEADALQAEVAAARQARERGETERHRQHLEIIAGCVKAMVDARLIPDKEGRAVIETAQQMFAKDRG